MKYNLVYFDDQIQNLNAYTVLLQERFNITGCHDTSKYLDILKSTDPHAFLIDLHMPGLNGLELYQKILESSHYNGCPIFFISVDQTEESRLKSHAIGGIDFLDRNLSEEELTLRLISKIKFFLQGTSILTLGNLRLNSINYTTFIDDKVVDLTMVEMRLLCMLMRSLPEPVSKKELLEKVWGESSKDGKIYVHVSNLGVKLWDWNHEIKIKGEFVHIVPC